MKKICVLFSLIQLCFGNLIAQDNFPQLARSDEESIQAFWYSCPKDSIFWEHTQAFSYLNSHMQVYGKIPADSFEVKVDVFAKENGLIFSRTYSITDEIESDSLNIKFNELWFRISDIVPNNLDLPLIINVKISSLTNKISRTIKCKYHRIYGEIMDFSNERKKGFILIHPDGFELEYGVWSDENGFYEIFLPERSYNTFYINDGFYKVNTLETWRWHMLVDSEQNLDFKIGTGEIYNLNVWANNGGSSTYFISFRPMVLYPAEKNYDIKINDNNYEMIDLCPKLEKSDITVKINGVETKVYSVQKYYETGTKWSLPSYLVQVKKLPPRIGKQTIQFEFLKTVNIDGESKIQSAMGYFELYLNFIGLSNYQ